MDGEDEDCFSTSVAVSAAGVGAEGVVASISPLFAADMSLRAEEGSYWRMFGCIVVGVEGVWLYRGWLARYLSDGTYLSQSASMHGIQPHVTDDRGLARRRASVGLTACTCVQVCMSLSMSPWSLRLDMPAW